MVSVLYFLFVFGLKPDIVRIRYQKTNRAITYHSMVGIGDPKKAQSSKAGRFAMTWYSVFAEVRIRGGSATTFLKGTVNTGYILGLQ